MRKAIIIGASSGIGKELGWLNRQTSQIIERSASETLYMQYCKSLVLTVRHMIYHRGKPQHRLCRRGQICLSVFLFLMIVWAQNICAATLTVTRTDDRNGTCASNLDCSLREAVSAAASNDTIVFSPTVFNVPRVITLMGSGISIFDKNLNIAGPGADRLTVRIFDPSQYEVFNIGGTNLSVNISGLKIIDGANGIRIGFSNVTANLDGLVISNNAGEGVFITGSVVNISNSTISNNSGGINCNNEATLTVINSTVSGNKSVSGGGIINFSTLNLVNSTITNNTATVSGGGIGNFGTVKLLNTIIAGNTAPNVPDANGIFLSQGNNLIGNTSGNSGWTASDKTNLPANLAPLALNGGITLNHLPNTGSAAINAGNSCVLTNACLITLPQPLNFDQRGMSFPRRAGNTVDIGAVERSLASVAGISGRITSQTGRGTAGVLVALTNPAGETRFTITNPFGYYRFVNLPTDTNYNISIISKQFTFLPQSVSLTDEISNLDFVAIN